MKRVVVTGMGAVSPLAIGVRDLADRLAAGVCATRRMDGWEIYKGLRSLVAAPAELRDEHLIPRKDRRSMGRMSIFAAQAARQAIEDAGLDPGDLPPGRCGCAIGSTMGSSISLTETFELVLPNHDLTGISSMAFFKCMSHTASMNLAQHLNLTGVVLAPAAACASGLQAIGTAYELIAMGRQDLILCGGAEELHPTVTGAFDVLYATSVGFNDRPGETPRPFDARRDGLVCGEGAGIVVLEEYEHARRRDARIHAELLGYHTCGSGAHVSQSSREGIARCLRGALAGAGVGPGEVDYVNAHATGTLHGDVEEAAALAEVFGDRVPVSGFKGSMGHTLGASGALELIASLEMAGRGMIFPTVNLEEVAPDCGGVDHVTAVREQRVGLLVKNAFAFGGINAVVVCRNLRAQPSRSKE